MHLHLWIQEQEQLLCTIVYENYTRLVLLGKAKYHNHRDRTLSTWQFLALDASEIQHESEHCMEKALIADPSSNLE